jgi:dolichyl-phosphate beta-glucosyltransferase
VIIPAYNEEARIGPTLSRILEYLDGRPYASEVLVVIDGSRDATIDRINAVAATRRSVSVIDNGVNRGKGFSVRRGMLEARGRFLLFSDADLSTPIEEVETFLDRLEGGADVVIASRALPESTIVQPQPWWRQAMGRAFNHFVRAMALPGIQDSQCGFKCFKRDVARRIFPRQRVEQFGFDVEVLWIAQRLGCRIDEVPVRWMNHPLSKVHPILDSSRMLADLFRIRYNDWRDVYGTRRAHALEPVKAAARVS